MRIEIQTIPHSSQRYETVGDFLLDDDGAIQVRVSEMGNDDYAFLVAIHELVELWLCRKRNISFEAIDAFDIAFEAARPEGDLSEPGDDPKSPYRDMHCLATGVERMLCAALGLSWAEYDAAVNALSRG